MAGTLPPELEGIAMTAEDAERFMERIKAPVVPLHPDLEKRVFHRNGFPILDHPLIQVVPYFENLNGLLNEGYEQKCASLLRAVDERRFERIVALHEKPHQTHALIEVEPMIRRDVRWWKLVRWVWQRVDNIHQNLDIWRSIWIDGRPGIAHVMEHDERARLRSLPATFTVWRGSAYGDYAQNGMSWTLSKGQAIWFANRFAEHQGEPVLAEGVVARDRVLGLFDGNEQEVVLNPDDLLDLDVALAPRISMHQPGAKWS